MVTTIKLSEKTKSILEKLKEKGDSYEDVVIKLINKVKDG